MKRKKRATPRNKKGRIRRLFMWSILGASLLYGLQLPEGVRIKQQVIAKAQQVWPIYERYWGPYFTWANQQKDQFIASVHTAHELIVGDSENNRLHFTYKPTTRNVA